jgi:hypothetical protein
VGGTSVAVAVGQLRHSDSCTAKGRWIFQIRGPVLVGVSDSTGTVGEAGRLVGVASSGVAVALGAGVGGMALPYSTRPRCRVPTHMPSPARARALTSREGRPALSGV